MDQHPGGDALMRGAGVDRTVEFHGAQHPAHVFETVRRYQVRAHPRLGQVSRVMRAIVWSRLLLVWFDVLYIYIYMSYILFNLV